jgi:hypothetical protein
MAEGPQAMAQVMTQLMNAAMRFEREQFLGAGHYERNSGRSGYANGTKLKKIDTPAGTLTLDVPKTAGTAKPFFPQSLGRGRRSCRAVMLAAAEMYVSARSSWSSPACPARASRASPSTPSTPRGSAPLCREPVGLCAAVSGADAEARCGPHRRPFLYVKCQLTGDGMAL